MSFIETALLKPRPDSIWQNVVLPRRRPYYPSPADWRDEVFYFLMVDRFSDGREAHRPLLDRANLAGARPAIDGGPWRWDMWAKAGGERWQGGTLEGVKSKLGYLKALGVTALWLSPIFKQRVHLDTYHGYGIEDFLEVDPHFGTRRDLVELIAAAHAENMRVMLDVVFNHSGANWLYPDNQWTPPYKAFPEKYPFGAWLDAQGRPTPVIHGADDGVWPREFQNTESYTRAGDGSLDAGAIDDPHAEHKRTDFSNLRDFELDAPGVLDTLARCYKYWISALDIDAMRIDTLKHVSLEDARNFCGSIKEFATNLGKSNFFLVGEIAGGTYNEDLYLDVLQHNLNAALDIGNMRPLLEFTAKGIADPREYFSTFTPGRFKQIGSHRHSGARYVSVCDDHDHVFGEKVRFSADAASDHQVAAAVALQLFSLGIPCIYYGTEQALGGPEVEERKWLPGWKSSDRYLREAMFGPPHPRKPGSEGLHDGGAGTDPELPGFGPFGTAGHHCFDDLHPAYVRIAAMTDLRKRFPTLRYGRQYLRQTSFAGKPFDFYGAGEFIAWSRILDDEELLCIVNGHGTDARGADVIVDATLNRRPSDPHSPTVMTVVLNTAQSAAGQDYAGSHPVGSAVEVKRRGDGAAYVELRNVGPSETLVLTNHDQPEDGEIRP
ncbi:MAG TPA: alpha-amylase family glycosyl hydrolase [Steroidobacteraceae bacterium]|nr:alpha-amylase family glycosyl hydrolase [Steroidobacteraceae bacterium]